MITVHKYALPITDAQTVTMPFGAAIVHVGLKPRGDHIDAIIDEFVLNLWAIVDSDEEHAFEDRRIVIRGTGHPLPDDANADTHIASVVAGPLVWHVFDVTEVPF